MSKRKFIAILFTIIMDIIIFCPCYLLVFNNFSYCCNFKVNNAINCGFSSTFRD